jgi:hypothetical protein
MGKEMEKKTGQFNLRKSATENTEDTEEGRDFIKSKLASYPPSCFLCALCVLCG